MYIKILHNKILLKFEFVKVKEKLRYQVIRAISNYDFVFRTKKR